MHQHVVYHPVSRGVAFLHLSPLLESIWELWLQRMNGLSLLMFLTPFCRVLEPFYKAAHQVLPFQGKAASAQSRSLVICLAQMRALESVARAAGSMLAPSCGCAGQRVGDRGWGRPQLQAAREGIHFD